MERRDDTGDGGKRQMKNTVLRVINTVAFVVFLLGACTLDSDSYIPLIMAIGGAAWLMLFYFVNAEILEDRL